MKKGETKIEEKKSVVPKEISKLYELLKSLEVEGVVLFDTEELGAFKIIKIEE